MLARDAKVFVAGHGGLIGSALVRRLEAEGFGSILTATRDELDLRDQGSVDDFFAENRPEYVYLAAGTVAGIGPNLERPAEFLYDNMMISATVIEAANRTPETKKLVYLASSSAYPRSAAQPVREDALLTGPLEPSNEGYALAEIIGLKLCETYRRQYGRNFVTLVPCNVYGPNDKFDDDGPVIPALMSRFHAAKERGETELVVWGSGTARREFLYVDDLASAALTVMEYYDAHGQINVGSGQDLPVRELAGMIRDVAFPEAELVFDDSKPGGIARKLLESSQIHGLGWKATTPLAEGLQWTYEWYCAQ